MFSWLGRIVARGPVWVIVAWVVAAVALGAASAVVLDDKSTVAAEETDFLPSSYESVQAMKIAERAFPAPKQEGGTATLVLSRPDGTALTKADQAAVARMVKALNAGKVPGVKALATSPEALSPNRKVQLAQVAFTVPAGDPQARSALGTLRTKTQAMVKDPVVVGRAQLQAGYTGEVAGIADQPDTEALVTIGMVVMIVLLLLVIFRSPLIAVFNVLVIVLVSIVAGQLIGLGAEALDVEIDDTATGLLPVVLFGVGTDYVVFLLFRYRERLRLGEDKRTAMQVAVSRLGESIAVSALAVAVSFGALLLSGFGSFRVLGPVLAVAVLTMVLACLTLVPAVFMLLGRAAFWPSKAWQRQPRNGLAARTGDLVARRPMAVALAAVAILVGLGAASLGFKADYDSQSLPAGTESVRAMQQLESGFPAGVLAPTQVYLTGSGMSEPKAEAFAKKLAEVPVVGTVGGVRVNGNVAEVTLLLADDPMSDKALAGMKDQLRPAAHAAAPAGTTAWVGGQTSVFTDVAAVVERDQTVVFPIAGAMIGVVLLFMLRGLLAPLYLLAAVVGGFFATLGATVLAYQVIGGAPGLGFTLPIIVYMFVASIGTDYNILMIARIREELQAGHAPRQAAAVALRQAGAPVAAAGVILAGSFGVLAISPALGQIGFAVGTGVLLSTFVLSWLLIPALTALFGRAAFWPAQVVSGRHDDRSTGSTGSDVDPVLVGAGR